MNMQRFVAERRPSWDRLRELTLRAGGRPRRLTAAQLLETGALYRAAAADLSHLRRWSGDAALTREVEALTQAGRQLVYDSEHRRPQFLRFVGSTYWRLVASKRAALAVAAAALFVPAILIAIWALNSPADAIGQVPPEFRDVLNPGLAGTDSGMTIGEQAEFSAFLLTHNIQVSFGAFALGVLFGVGTIYILMTNGVMLGAIGGLLIGAGDGDFFVELVAAHGVLELSGIVVAGAAGLGMGWALVDPGERSRREALVAEARDAVLIVAGTIPVFILAGIIEGFVSRRGLPAQAMLIVGLSLGATYWGAVYTASRRIRRERAA